MAINTVKLPVTVNTDIQSAYVKLKPSDIYYSDFETSRLLTITATDTLNSSACSLTAAITGSFSAYYNNSQMILFNRGFYNSYSGLTSGFIGIWSLKKRFFDTGFNLKTLTATVTGTYAGDYYDSGSGQLIRKSSGVTVGCTLVDDGIFVVTASDLANIVLSITSIKYNARVHSTSLNVFCKCPHDQLNYSLNPTVFNATAVGNWMSDPLTSSTSGAEIAPFLVSSGIPFSPMITRIGLYDDDNNLLVIGNLSQPVKKSNFTSTSIICQLDL